jgi:hypothetical protein
VTLSACTDLAGLTGGNGDDSVFAPPARDAATHDAFMYRADAAAEDSPGTVEEPDATSDSAPREPGDSNPGADVHADAADAMPAAFCASLGAAAPPKLCADFDTGLFSASFSTLNVSSGATLAADTRAFSSPPSSLLATLPAAAQSDGVAFLARTFTGMATSVVYAFDLRIDSWVTGGKAAVVATVVVNDGLASEHSLRFYLTDTYAAVEEAFVAGTTQYVDHRMAVAPRLGTWTRVELRIDLASRTCNASLGGVPALMNVPLDATWAPGTPEVHLGLSYVGSQASPWAVRFDDVVVNWN